MSEPDELGILLDRLRALRGKWAEKTREAAEPSYFNLLGGNKVEIGACHLSRCFISARGELYINDSGINAFYKEIMESSEKRYKQPEEEKKFLEFLGE